MIHLTAAVENLIRAEGEKAYPNECCGFLFGSANDDGRRNVTRARPVKNASEDAERYHRFRIEPDAFLRATREAYAEGLDIAGFYHSHPDHPAVPSEYDREQALPCYSYIIVAVDNGVAGDLTSWELSLDRGKFNRELTEI
ncbi:MAG: M67 family metallopeptidase [Desulfovibrio sp.]|jgi:proteasome lid subunit RPN8/RPN11|nr:M67 family metallopeptidase [Desulfovibrio sp.]